MSTFKLIFELLMAIPQALSALRDLISWWNKIQKEKAAERAKQAVDDSVKTGDQRPIEEAIGSPNAGKPSKENIPGLKTRPIRDRSSDGL